MQSSHANASDVVHFFAGLVYQFTCLEMSLFFPVFHGLCTCLLVLFDDVLLRINYSHPEVSYIRKAKEV